MPRRKKAIICFFSLVAVLSLCVAIDLACGPEPDPYDYGVSFFHNNISGGKAYRAFYFTSGQTLYDSDEPVNEEDVNSREWAAYLGGKVKPADVKKVMYHLNHKSDSVLLHGYLNLKNQIPDSLKQNTFLHALKRNQSALLYYRLVKILEPAVGNYEPWENESPDTNRLLKTVAYALKEAGSAKDRFLKIRYYYQAQRLYHFTGRNKQAIDIYEKHIVRSHPGYYVAGLALGLRAGEERRTGNPAKAAYFFSKLFTDFPERRIKDYQNYVFIKVPEKDVIAFAKNGNEKGVLYAMDGFYTPTLSTKYLRKVYQTKPNSPFVEILLTREINKLEGAYLTAKLTDKLPYDNKNTDYYGYNDYLKKEKNIGKYINELKDFCTLIASEHKCKQPALGLIARAYLEWMTGNTKAGFAQLTKVKDAVLNGRLYDHEQMVKLLLITQGIKGLDKISEQKLVPSLRWLNKKVNQELKDKGEEITTRYDYEGGYRLQRYRLSARDLYQKLLAPMYLSQHDTTKAALAMLKGMPYLIGDTLRSYHENVYEDHTAINFWQNYLHSSNLCKIISYKKIGTNDPYLTILTSGLKKTSFDCLYNLLGTAYIREHNYKQAVLALSKIKKHSAKDFPLEGYAGIRFSSNPFIEQLNDYPKNYHPGKSGGYSKLRFAKAMYNLQTAIKQNPKKSSQYYFAMAIGLYNTSSHGNAWFLITYAWYDNERESPAFLYFDRDLNQTIDAETVFLKARRLSTNTEFKAKCTFMAAKCKQNRYKGINDEFENQRFYKTHTSAYRNEIKRNGYLEELKKSYPDTRFFKIAVGECSYFRDFLPSADTKRTNKKK